jgi:hypothetical protein
MIRIDFCKLERQPATGLRYVMVRFSCGEPVREQAQWQMSAGEWQQFLELLKPSRSLDVIEVPLERWRAV